MLITSVKTEMLITSVKTEMLISSVKTEMLINSVKTLSTPLNVSSSIAVALLSYLALSSATMPWLCALRVATCLS